MSEYVKLSQDTMQVVKDKNLIRRRFYLSKEALLFLDSLSVQQNQSPSILLDTILVTLYKKTVH
jgi:hypothetical protein